MILFHNFHSSHTKEHKFLKLILYQFPDIKHINQTFDLTLIDLDKHLDIRDIADSLRNDNHLPIRRKRQLLEILDKIPHSIKIINSLSDITVDFTFEINNTYYFFELHEKQHKKLSNNRKSRIYSANGETIYVPRFVQRFLRDIWRFKNLPNYRIIWDDWFENNYENFNFNFDTGFFEYHDSNSFSFSKLLNK